MPKILDKDLLEFSTSTDTKPRTVLVAVPVTKPTTPPWVLADMNAVEEAKKAEFAAMDRLEAFFKANAITMNVRLKAARSFSVTVTPEQLQALLTHDDVMSVTPTRTKRIAGA